MVVSAFMIALHPDDLNSSLSSEVQASDAAQLSLIASRLLVLSMTRVLKCAIASEEGSSSIRLFKSNLLWYRFSLRFFFESMDQVGIHGCHGCPALFRMNKFSSFF